MSLVLNFKKENCPSDVIVGNLSHIMATHPTLVQDFEKRYDLKSLSASEGAFVFIPKKMILKEPLELLFEAKSSHKYRNLIFLQENSEATIVERYVGEGAYETKTTTEVIVSSNAVLEHYKWQEESFLAAHESTMNVHQERSSQFTSHAMTLGAKVSKNHLNSTLNDEGVGCFFNGLYLGGEKQTIYNETTIDHAKPHGTSVELYKGILSEQAQATFNGRIIVRPQAQKTNARQMNKNLLLSNEAVVNTQPILEIFANDVKCQHGATIGRLDEQSLFYLRTRGIGDSEARSLLTVAFAGDVLSQMKLKSVREKLENLIYERLMDSRSELKKAKTV